MRPKSAATSWSEVVPPAGRPQPRLAAVVALPRSEGRARVAFKRRDGLTVLAGLAQQGSAKVRLPRVEPGAWPEAVVINTAGGLTGGDRLALAFDWGPGTQASVVGQAAEKVYRALAGVARVETRITVAAGAAAEWLPQETILFDRACLERRTEVILAPDACFLGLEALVFGRTAMGESVEEGRLLDSWRIRRGGRLILAEALRLEGPITELMARRAIAGGACAVATLVHAAPDAAARLEPLREALAGARGLAAASAWGGLLVARFLAPEGASLRADLVRALGVLRAGRALPRVWSC